MWRFGLIVLVLSFGGLPAIGWAQITLEAHLGLQGTVRLEKWNRVTVSLYNAGAPLQGTLGVRVWRGSEYRKDLHVLTFTRAVRLPHRARKRFSFTVPIASITHPIDVFMQSAGVRLAQQQLDLRDALSAEHIIVGLTQDLSLDFLATAFQRHTRVTYLQVPELPHDWSGYDSVTAMVMKGVSLQSATQRQWVALQQWIIRGGTLVVAGDSQVALLQEPRVQSLLPVDVLGLQEQQGLPRLAEYYQVPVPSVPLIAVQARLQRGQVLVGTPQTPLLAQRRLGQGRVVFLAVDYAARPLDTWAGNQAFWKDILQPTDDIDFGRVFAELGLLDDTHPIIKLLSRPILAYPSHMLLSVLLLAYCGLLGLFFWWMRRRRARPARYWAYGGLILVAATVMAYGVFPERALRDPALLYDLSTLEVYSGADSARARGYLGVFSARGGQFDLSFQHPTTLLRHTFHKGAGKAGETLEVTTGGAASAIRGIRLDPWTLRVFSVESMTAAPIEIKAERHSTGMTVRVRNQGTIALEGAVVVSQGRLFPLGMLKPGEELFEDLYTTLQPAESQYETTWQALFKHRPQAADSRVAYLQEVLLQHHFGESHLMEASAQPFLAGWLYTPTLLASSPGSPAVDGMTLVFSPLVPDSQPAGAGQPADWQRRGQ
jgi:hypothetical protein